MNYFRKFFGGSFPINYPKKNNKSHYDSIIKKYIIHLKKFEEVKAVLQIGNIGVYGISDLDFLIILDDKKNIKEPKKYSIYNLVPKNHKIVQHESFIVPLCLVKDIAKVFREHLVMTKILAASVRDVRSVGRSFEYGADIVTMPPTVFEKMYNHILTDKGLELFQADYEAVANVTV